MKAIWSQIADGRMAAAHELAQSAWRHRPDHLQLQDLLISTLQHRGDSERALELCLENARRRIGWLRRRRIPGRAPQKLGPQQRIFISGYFNSGSSAVFDYLRGLEGVTGWAPDNEMRLVKGPGGMADMAWRHRKQRELTPVDFVDFYLHLTGWKSVAVPPGHYNTVDVVNRASAHLFRHRTAFGYLIVCLRRFVRMASDDLSHWTRRDLERYFRGTVRRALNAAATDSGSGMLVIDQAVNAWRLPIARFVPKSVFVVVHRDPRDQYYDTKLALQKPGRRPKAVGDFADQYRRRRIKAAQDIVANETEYGHRSIQLSFEDFVLDHDAQAAQLKEQLSLSNRRVAAKLYKPDWAISGAGRYLGKLDAGEVELLVSELPEFLDHRLDGV